MATVNIKQVIGANIRRLRSIEGLSQVEFGERVGGFLGRSWSAQTVSGAETGKREFIAVELVVLCQVLNCTIGDLIGGPSSAEIVITPDLSLSSADISALALGARSALERATDAELANEVLRRMSDGSAHAALSDPYPDQGYV